MGRVDVPQGWETLVVLVVGLAEAEMESGEQFVYDGARLYSEDVADMLLPSMLCLAQGVADYVGMGNLGYEFGFDTDSKAAFPLYAKGVTGDGASFQFHRVAPFLVEVFDSYVLENRADVARVFEAAAQTLDASFTLEQRARVGRARDTGAQHEPRT